MLSTTQAIGLNKLLSLGILVHGERSSQPDENLNTFIDSHSDGIVMLSAILDEKEEVKDFSYTFINGTAEKLLKKSRYEMIGERLLDLFPGTEKDGIFEIYKKVFHTGRSAVLQFHYLHEGFDTTFRQKIEKFEEGILVHTSDISKK